jgi:hypothetical protein
MVRHSSHSIFVRLEAPGGTRRQAVATLHVAVVAYPKGVTLGVHDPASGQAFDQVAAWLGARDLFTAETLCMGIVHASVGGTHPYEAAFTIRELLAATYAVVHISVANDGPGAMAKAITAMDQAGRYALARRTKSRPV